MNIPASLLISREDAAKAEISALLADLKAEGWKMRRIAYVLNVDEKSVREWASKASQPNYGNALALIALHQREVSHETRGEIPA